MQGHAAGVVVIHLEPAFFHNAAAAFVKAGQCGGYAVSSQQITLARLQHGDGLVLGVSEIGNRAEGVFSVLGGAGVQQHVATRESRFHLRHLFGLDFELARHSVDLLGAQCFAVGIQIRGRVFALEPLLHGAQVEEQLALRLGGGHFDHAPVLENVFVNFCLYPVQRVAHQAHALLGVKALDRLHQPHIALLNQIAVR